MNSKNNNKITLPSIHLLLKNESFDYSYRNKIQPKIINQNKNTEINELSLNKKTSFKKCINRNCYLCCRFIPKYLKKKPTWENKILVAFYSICRNKNKDTTSLVSLKKDLYPFIEQHAHLLFLQDKIQIYGWKKQLQDILNHKKYIFESGVKEMKGSTGYWKIKYQFIDPWKLETTAKKTIQTYRVQYAYLFNNSNL